MRRCYIDPYMHGHHQPYYQFSYTGVEMTWGERDTSEWSFWNDQSLAGLVRQSGISHETSHFELDHSEQVHNEHAVELSEDCSTCLAETSEFALVYRLASLQLRPLISLILIMQAKSPFQKINSLFARRQ